MRASLPGRDEGEIEAIIVDRYLDSLLARGPRDEAAVGADVRRTSAWLSGGLPRYHPSFVFEERLAATLSRHAIAVRAGTPTRTWTPTGTGPATGQRDGLSVLPFHSGSTSGAMLSPAGRGSTPVRPVVIGGVLTSAAISLAGVAFVAWRRTHPGLDPMTRAVRSVARTKAV